MRIGRHSLRHYRLAAGRADHASTAIPGVATWRTRQFGDIRVRLVEYSPGYVADHWCEKGHILFCVEGELQPISRTAGPSR